MATEIRLEFRPGESRSKLWCGWCDAILMNLIKAGRFCPLLIQNVSWMSSYFERIMNIIILIIYVFFKNLSQLCEGVSILQTNLPVSTAKSAPSCLILSEEVLNHLQRQGCTGPQNSSIQRTRDLNNHSLSVARQRSNYRLLANSSCLFTFNLSLSRGIQ